MAEKNILVGKQGVGRYNAWRANLHLRPVSSVPLETQGGAGSIGSHWPESLFKNELMTSSTNIGNNPCSALTMFVMQDLGYVCIPGGWEPYQFQPNVAFDKEVYAINDDGALLNTEDTLKLHHILSKKMYSMPSELTNEQKELFGIPLDLPLFHEL